MRLNGVIGHLYLDLSNQYYIKQKKKRVIIEALIVNEKFYYIHMYISPGEQVWFTFRFSCDKKTKREHLQLLEKDDVSAKNGHRVLSLEKRKKRKWSMRNRTENEIYQIIRPLIKWLDETPHFINN